MAGILKLKNELDNSWTDIPALIGPQGKSAYQLAVENGFKGTESEWLASLKGADGEVTFESLTDEQKASLKGDTGETGATFIPSVSEDGTLSWINDKDFINPTPVNIRGPQGAQGEQGIQGLQGPQGEKGDKGDTGEQGTAGYTPVRGTDYWTEEDQAAIVADVLAALPAAEEVSV